MKLILGVEYDGSKYFGWQRQQDGILSIQECLECAISKVANEEVEIFCASRTDSGVHALCQVVHFTTCVFRSNFSWVSGINRYLPVDIVVIWIIKALNLEFHARFSAIARKYRYIIYNHDIRSALFNKRVSYYKKFLDIKKMQNASKCLLGEQDFASFRASRCQSSSSFRNLHYISIMRYGDYVIIDIQANGFLHHMVRNIVGSLLEVGWGYRSENWIAELLLKRNRSLAGITASPYGLYLVKISYPSCHCIPIFKDNCGFVFLR